MTFLQRRNRQNDLPWGWISKIKSNTKKKTLDTQEMFYGQNGLKKTLKFQKMIRF